MSVAVPTTGLAAMLSVDSLSAAVSSQTIQQATEAALHFLAGQSVPVEVITLAKGCLKAMFIHKVKVVSAVVMALSLVGGGLAWIGRPMGASASAQPGEVAPVHQECAAYRAGGGLGVAAILI